ncbi:MAG: class I SAM-dependent methyltransferase [Bdellovibrionota bacterium]
MKAGDFTDLAKAYHHRLSYSATVLSVIAKRVGAFEKEKFLVADVGAGTGKLTENLCSLGVSVVAVEPNDAMRTEGAAALRGKVEFRAGSGEQTGLDTGSADWLLMASSFHWVDTAKGLAEFHRVLKPGGYFTALWNPRDLERSQLHKQIEDRIKEIVPTLDRRSSGSSKFTEDLDLKLVSTGHFEDCFYLESRYEITMPVERYIGAWTSVNDIQVQAGPDRWKLILSAIEDACRGMQTIVVPYRTRAWTVRRK